MELQNRDAPVPLQQSLKQLDAAFKNFFNSLKGGASQKCKSIRENKDFSLQFSCFCKTEMHP
ncbi:hypothetical protein CKA32_000551 [Geitlerinema sp. FC II]|nr:hypothetical protein CKA32_000551 [Geitlerinema sp. FC II]